VITKYGDKDFETLAMTLTVVVALMVQKGLINSSDLAGQTFEEARDDLTLFITKAQMEEEDK